MMCNPSAQITMTPREDFIAPGRLSAPSELIEKALLQVRDFYKNNPHIKESHGISHVLAVFRHAEAALECSYELDGPVMLRQEERDDILLAALLHDTDDSKYFTHDPVHESPYPNARRLLGKLGEVFVSDARRVDRIIRMIDWVSCSKNGNKVPDEIQKSHEYHWLIPRWSDRLEAVGRIGVIRCYQYCVEHGGVLCSDESPRPTSVEDVWRYATPERFEAYQERGGSSADMISHYYDKLLHVACPPKAIVRNKYLENKGEESAKELMDVCLRYGKTGSVDEDYLRLLPV